MMVHDAADPAPPAHAALLRELFARQEHERRQVARALHNEIGQAVSAIKMSAHLAVDEEDAAQRAEDLRDIVRIADDTVARLRDLYSLLRPPQIDALGLEASLRAEADHWRARWQIGAELRVSAMEPRPQPAIELAAFRLVQDLLQPQAALAHLRIEVDGSGDRLRLEISHDGAPPDALTLALLRARTDALHGHLELDAAPQRVHMRAIWPAREDAGAGT